MIQSPPQLIPQCIATYDTSSTVLVFLTSWSSITLSHFISIEQFSESCVKEAECQLKHKMMKNIWTFGQERQEAKLVHAKSPPKLM